MKQLNMLVITDMHYIGVADHICKIQKRRADIAMELLKRVFRSVDMRKIDVIILPGDLVDEGYASGADEDLEEIKAILQKTGKPYIITTGNHERNSENALKILEDHEGLHNIEGYQIITFADYYETDNNSTRDMAKMEEFFSSIDVDRPVIVIQHNPVYPPIDKAHPFNFVNSEQITGFYSKKGVLLSISGHAHWGIPVTEKDSVGYYTCPAISESPYKYAVVTLNGNEYSISEHSLLLNKDLGLTDLHMHTNFAYCGEDVSITENIRYAQEIGLDKIAITEHAGQLYVDTKDYWSARFVNEPELIYQNRSTPLNRMKEFREAMKPYRSDSVLIGLEVELDCNGNIVLLEEDRDGWDLIVGAVHYLPSRYEKGSKEGFMWANEKLLRHGVDVLAHPFRYFIRSKMPVPEELYRPLAEMLAATGTAAELNYHTNDNDAKFFKLCIDLGVPVSLASDGHALCEIGSFNRHLELLQSIYPIDKINEILYRGRNK